MSGGRRSGQLGLGGMKQSLLGGASSGSSAQGGREAKASGPRGPGTRENVSFSEKSKINANELDPTGTIVGTLPFDGEAPTGEARLKIREIMTGAQDGAQSVERQVIPAEYRELVREFQESLHEAASTDDAADGK